MRWHRTRVALSIVPGELTAGGYCGTCDLPSRVAVPLHAGTRAAPVAVLSMCAYCGHGNLPDVTLTTPPAARPGRRRPWAAVLWVIHRRQCRRAGRPARECAYGDCRRPGWYGCACPVRDDGGTTWLLFCGRRHRRRWSDAAPGT